MLGRVDCCADLDLDGMQRIALFVGVYDDPAFDRDDSDGSIAELHFLQKRSAMGRFSPPMRQAVVSRPVLTPTAGKTSASTQGVPQQKDLLVLWKRISRQEGRD